MRDALLLAAALGAYGWYLRGGPFGPGFLAARRFARLAARSAALFGGAAVAALAVMGRLGAIVRLPREFADAAVAAQAVAPGLAGPDALALMALAMVIGGAIGAGVSRWRGRVFSFGDVTAVLPRTRPELGWAALLAATSGWTEELFFRLLLPLLAARLTGSAAIGFAVATALFGLAHRYQGWLGVAATTFVGALLSAIYLASGALWLAITLHLAINLNGLVIRPLAMGKGGAERAPFPR